MAAHLLGLWVRIPPGGRGCLSVVSVVCCQVEVRGGPGLLGAVVPGGGLLCPGGCSCVWTDTDLYLLYY